jgi:hypothetical protein
MAFWPKHDQPFNNWVVKWDDSTPNVPHPMGLIKAYCALKWLLLENPPSSRDRDDAWTFVHQELTAPLLLLGIRTQSAQRERARKSRGKLNDQGITLLQIITRLVQRPGNRAAQAKELWPGLHSELDKADLDPEETQTPAKNPAYTYVVNGNKRQISLRRFANLLSELRKKKFTLTRLS